LFAHAAGYWAKKIRGKLYYFGKWDDPDGALNKYLDQKDALHGGRKPRPDVKALTVKGLANAFLNHKLGLLEAGEITQRTWGEYEAAAELLVKEFGKQRLAADLDTDDMAGLRAKLAKRWGPVCLGNLIQRIRSIFKYGYEAELLDKPMRFGPGFKRPTKKTLRLERAKKGPQMFEADEIRKLLDAAGLQLKAMILLAVNCGLGNTDCGRLPLTALDLERGWLDYPRPKTGIGRRCWLWPETVAAVREALAKRPTPKMEEHAGLVFVTKYGGTWDKGNTDNPLSAEVRKLLNALGINGRRNFYALRHTFETIGGEAKDQVAVDHIMGHAREDMASVYRERVSDERLKAVAEHVRAWLFSAGEA
jgi:integrase